MALRARDIFFSIILICYSSTGVAQGIDRHFEDAIDNLARQIDATLNAQASQTSSLRVAIWPFEETDIPVSKALADELNARLLNRLLEAKRQNVVFVARRELKELVSDIHNRAPWNETRNNPVAALMQSTADVDILIIGAMRLHHQSIHLRYEIVRQNGELIAALRPEQIQLDTDDVAGVNQIHPLDTAIETAGEALFAQALGIRSIRLAGIYFQDSGLQPPFGRYLEEQISTSLQIAVNDELTGRTLEVSRTDLSEKALKNVIGSDVTSDALWMANSTGRTLEQDKGAYILHGSYWDFGTTVEVRFEIRDQNRKAASWRGRIRKESVGQINLHPDTYSDTHNFKEDKTQRTRSLGPIALRLTTARGHNPVYTVGEKLNLLLRIDQPGWLYCFYEQANGEIIQILPNPISLRRHPSARLEGNIIYAIPSRSLFPFNLRIVPPVGYEYIRCFAANRDISEALPPALRGRTEGPLPSGLAKRINELFDALTNVSITEQSLSITIVDQKD